MACRVVILESAQAEYEDIVRYLAVALCSPQAAAAFMDEFNRQIGFVREQPKMHALSSDPTLASQGYRAFMVKGYIALYRVAGGAVVIAHIFHQTQDYAKLV